VGNSLIHERSKAFFGHAGAINVLSIAVITQKGDYKSGLSELRNKQKSARKGRVHATR